MIRLDLHTHSTGSPDGGIRLEEYKKLLDDKDLDVIAITDHDSIEQAVTIQKQLGERSIVGEEITTKDGEIIGLYLTQKIAPGLSAKDTVAALLPAPPTDILTFPKHRYSYPCGHII